MDRLGAMATLVEAIEAGSLSAAGRKLGVPLATLSRRISDLEASLGVKLLVRGTRHLALTPAGTSYVAASRKILECVGVAEREAVGEYEAPKGELVLTAPLAFGRRHVLPVVTAFLATYPDIRVHLAMSDTNVHLVDDRIDMAVRLGELPDSSLTATRVGSMRRIVCASPAFLAEHGMPETPSALGALPCVTHDQGLPATRWVFRDATKGTALEVPIHSRLSVTTAEAAVDAAVAGTGPTRVLLYQAAPAIAEGLLTIVLEPWEIVSLPCHLVHAARGQLPLKMRSFLDFAAPRLRAALTALSAS